MKSQDRKTIIVTGASRGLGLAIVRRLARENYSLVGIARNCSPELRELCQTAENVSFEAYDLSDLEGIHDLVKMIVEKNGRIYGLINNAAIGQEGILATMYDSQISETVTLNLISALILTKYAVRSMLLNKTGRVINISSIIANTGFSGLSVYAATKSAFVGFTKSLARELGPVGTTVNLIAPGFLQTDMTKSLAGEKLEKIRRRSPTKDFAKIEDIAELISLLLGDNGKSMTGATFTVDAGSTA